MLFDEIKSVSQRYVALETKYIISVSNPTSNPAKGNMTHAPASDQAIAIELIKRAKAAIRCFVCCHVAERFGERCSCTWCSNVDTSTMFFKMLYMISV